MVLWKSFNGALKRANLGDGFQQHLLEKPKHFRVGMKEIQTLYALSHWMLREGVVEQVYNRWGYMTINTHRELNFLWVRTIMRRVSLFILLSFIGGYVYGKPRFDWQDYHDPKFEQKTYGDLEEGGDDGGDDD